MNIPDHIALAPLIIKRLYFFQNSKKWSKDQLFAYQNSKLKEIVNYAGKYVPYYRNIFKKIGMDTREFKGIDDIN